MIINFQFYVNLISFLLRITAKSALSYYDLLSVIPVYFDVA